MQVPQSQPKSASLQIPTCGPLDANLECWDDFEPKVLSNAEIQAKEFLNDT